MRASAGAPLAATAVVQIWWRRRELNCVDSRLFSNLHEALSVARLRKLLFAGNHVRISYVITVIAADQARPGVDGLADKSCVDGVTSDREHLRGHDKSD